MEERVQAHERQAGRILLTVVIGGIIAIAIALIALLSPSEMLTESEMVQQVLAEFPEAQEVPIAP